MKTQEIIIIIDESHNVKGTVDITGFETFDDFIEYDKSKYLKVQNIVWHGSNHNLLILNKNKIIGYL